MPFVKMTRVTLYNPTQLRAQADAVTVGDDPGFDRFQAQPPHFNV
jgi:hypothetical protein